MKHYLIIIVLLFFASCKKDYITNLINQPKDAAINKPFQKFLNDLEITCPIDSIAFTNLKEWRKYLQQCVTLDSSSAENIPVGKYYVMIKFETLKTGDALNPEILNNPGYGLSEKALEIFKSFKGKWPFQEEAENNKSYMYQPITFEIADE